MPFLQSFNELSHTTTGTHPNYSILAIPAYWVLSVAPHAGAIWLASQGNLKNYNNVSPRSDKHRVAVKERLSAEQYARFERIEAASANSLENLPLFATAIVLGNLAGFKKEGWKGLYGFAAAFLALRTLHTATYISTTDNAASYLRSGLWVSSSVLCLNVITKSALALGGVLKGANISGGSAFRAD
jgi:uncharacterized MAPEG superfamily protein